MSNENKIDLKWNIDTGYMPSLPDWILWLDPEDFAGYEDDELEDALYDAAVEEMTNKIGVYMPNLNEVKQMIADYRDRNENE